VREVAGRVPGKSRGSGAEGTGWLAVVPSGDHGRLEAGAVLA
jgi:hypothetical protein